MRQAHAESFLDSLRGRADAPASVRTMRTYLAEIHRVFTHLQAIGVEQPTLHQWCSNASGASPRPASPPIPLPPGPSFLAAYERMAARLFEEESDQLPDGWTPARNLALRLVVAECGLKLSEVCKLIPRNITLRPDGSVVVRAPGTARSGPRAGRPRPAGEGAATAAGDPGTLRVVRTRREREENARNSNRLFLGQADMVQSTELVGGGLGAACSPVAPDLGERVVTSCVKRTLESLGHQAAFHGPQLVRNAYAARLIASGMSDAEVSDQLGMKTTFTARAIREKVTPVLESAS